MSTWILFVWIGYASEHSTITKHQFRSEALCQAAGQRISEAMADKTPTRVRFVCFREN